MFITLRPYVEAPFGFDGPKNLRSGRRTENWLDVATNLLILIACAFCILRAVPYKHFALSLDRFCMPQFMYMQGFEHQNHFSI